VIPHHDLDAATNEIWERILRVNVLGTWNVSKAAVPHLRAAGDGVVLNITSLAGVRPVGSSIPYAVSKAAVNHLTVLLANALGPEIRVHAVAPGLIDTPWTADWDALRETVREAAPLRRTGSPQDVADACVALIDARYATGQVLVVDGGMALR
jgi:ketoreductase RED2